MLDSVSVRKLEILSAGITRCKKCTRIRKNGIAVPFWSGSAKYISLAEAPGKDEVEQGTPLVGSAGQMWERMIKKYGFERADFILINATQCRPLNGSRNGKPTREEVETCSFWVSQFIMASGLKHIVAFGNYAMQSLFDEGIGIKSKCGSRRLYGHGIKVYPCVHPASLIYHPEDVVLFKRSMKRFRKETAP